MYLHRYFLLLLASFSLSSALIAQEDIDSLKSILGYYSTEDTVRIQLLNQLGLEYWIIDPIEADKYGNEALSISERINYDKGAADALRVIGVAHWTRGNYELGLLELLKAKALFEKTNDQLGVANCHLNIGLIFADQAKFDRALESYQLALKGFQKESAKGRIATTYNKIGEVFNRQKLFEEALKYLTYALKMHEEENFKYGIAESNNRLGELYLEKGNQDSALSYFLTALSISESLNDFDGMARGHLDIGQTFLNIGDYSKARKYLEKGEQLAKEIKSKKWLRDTYQKQRELAERLGNWKEANRLSSLYLSMKDSLFNEQLANRISEIEKRNELEAQQKQLEALQIKADLLTTKNDLERKLRLALTFGLLFLIISAYLLYNRQRLRIKKDRIIFSSEQERNSLALQKAQLEQSKLEQELATRDKELTTYTVNFIRKNQVLNELKEKISELKNGVDKSQQKEVVQLIRLTDSIQDMDKDWEEFRLYFENVHTDFFRKLNLNYQQLSAGDLRLAALVRLNLNLKEISSVLGISPDSVKTSRYRLKKKLGLAKEDSLLSFLINMDSSI